MSSFIVSARKYRPATFEEVVGQAHVADTLKNALKTDKLAHSFLFCGPRGVGKTTCARILAKIINCQNPVDKTQPCNECNSCLAFNDNASFNIIELDAASNNSVDNIRNLIDQVRVPPQQGRYKVFIIDEVHMLSTAAFNAFLKTLEEPPAYAIFILATTEKHKILPTILSRCQIFDFKRIQVTDAVLQLQEICRQEGITAEPEALHLIGQKADGAMRDALSIFDKVASSANGNLTYKDVITNLNILDYDYYFRVVDAFLREDLSEVLLIMDSVVRQGFDVDQFIQGLASHMRDLMVCKDQRTLSLLDVSDSLKARYTSQAQYATKSMLLSGLDILNQCDIALPRATNQRLYAEIALSKINYIQRTIDAEFVTGSATTTEKKTEVLTKQPAKPVVQVPASAPKIAESPVPPQVSEPAMPAAATVVETTQPPLVPAASQSADTGPAVVLAEQKPEPSALESTNANTTDTPAGGSLNNATTAPSPKPSTPTTPDPTPTPKPAAGMGLDLSLEGMMASITAEEEAISKAKERFGIEAINEIWAEYTVHNPSPSVQSALKRTSLALDGDEKLIITVPAAITGEIVINELPLQERIRTELGATQLTYHINVDPEAFPDFEQTRPATSLKPREKYQLILEKKPELKELIDKLEMRPDNEVAL